MARDPGELSASRRGSLRKIALLDTAAASTNLGDRIIMEAVHGEVDRIFSDSMIFSITSHEWMGPHSRRLIRQSNWAIAGGTSLLSSRMWFRSNWKVGPLDAVACLRVILLGVGWYQYQHAPDPYSRWILRGLLSRNGIHSVRDSYTLKMLASIGVDNVVNTGCPTLWPLTSAHCMQLPKQKAEAVLATVNSYPKLNNPEVDKRLLELLRRNYKTVYLWIQTHTDFEYSRSLDDGLVYVDPSVVALDELLSSALDIDYVGVRLHAGIRALQKGRRAVIIEIDNRAREMGRDFGLPTVERTDFERLEHMITQPLAISVHLPESEIERWRAQFGPAARTA